MTRTEWLTKEEQRKLRSIAKRNGFSASFKYHPALFYTDNLYVDFVWMENNKYTVNPTFSHPTLGGISVDNAMQDIEAIRSDLLKVDSMMKEIIEAITK